LIVASGGGHTGYANALAERLFELTKEYRDLLKIVFILPKRDRWSFMKLSLLKTLYHREVFFDELTKPREPYESFIKLIARFPKSLYEAVKIIGKYEPDIVVSTGSNHSLVVALASLLKKTRVVNIEAIDRIATTSKTSKILHDIGVETILHWSEQKRNLPRGIVVGPIFERPRYRPRDEGYILVTTGTMGHKVLFNLLKKTRLNNIVLQTGIIPPDEYRVRDWIVFDFDPDIDKWIAGARLVITHQGLTAVNAALAYKKPVIIAYNPLLKKTSTLEDTKILANKINALFIDPRRITPYELEEIVFKAMEQKPPSYTDGGNILAHRILRYLDMTT